MRTIIIYLFLAISTFAARAEDFGAVFTKGYEFYLRGDYPAAREMFAQIPPQKTELSALASYYLASISAFEGDGKAAERNFALALENAQTPQTCSNAFVQAARFFIANSDYAKVVEFSEKIPADLLGGRGKFYVAQALYFLGKKKESAKMFASILSEFDDKSSVGADMLVAAITEKKKFAAGLKLDFAPKTPAGIARADILAGRKIAQPFGEISFLAQTILAEQTPTPEILDALARAAFENSDSPFAWRAAVLLSKSRLDAKDYAQAMVFANDALKLSSPDTFGHFRALIAKGDVLRMQKKYAEAIEEYMKLYMNRRARGEPIAEAIYKTGLCFFEQGLWADAHVCFQRVFVAFFRFEYWGSRAYYYDAQALYSMGQRRDANATLLEYFRRAKDKSSEVYKAARAYYNSI